jgi:hypothetical protein
MLAGGRHEAGLRAGVGAARGVGSLSGDDAVETEGSMVVAASTSGDGSERSREGGAQWRCTTEEGVAA